MADQSDKLATVPAPVCPSSRHCLCIAVFTCVHLIQTFPTLPAGTFARAAVSRAYGTNSTLCVFEGIHLHTLKNKNKIMQALS